MTDPKKTIIDALMLCCRNPGADDMHMRTMLANAEMEASQILSDLMDDGFRIVRKDFLEDQAAAIERFRAAYNPDFTVQSEMRRCGKEIADLNIENERLKSIITADTHVLLSKRPVAFRVQDHPGCWMLFQDEEEARKIGGDALMQGLYARHGSPLSGGIERDGGEGQVVYSMPTEATEEERASIKKMWDKFCTSEGGGK